MLSYLFYANDLDTLGSAILPILPQRGTYECSAHWKLGTLCGPPATQWGSQRGPLRALRLAPPGTVAEAPQFQNTHGKNISVTYPKILNGWLAGKRGEPRLDSKLLSSI